MWLDRWSGTECGRPVTRSLIVHLEPTGFRIIAGPPGETHADPALFADTLKIVFPDMICGASTAALDSQIIDDTKFASDHTWDESWTFRACKSGQSVTRSVHYGPGAKGNEYGTTVMGLIDPTQYIQ